MDLAYPHLCGQLFEQPLMYDPRKAEVVLRALGPQLTGQSVTIVNGAGGIDHVAFANGRPSAGVIGDRMGRAYDRNGYAPFDMVDGVAIIPIEGSLVQKGGWIGAASGETSYQGLQTQIARAKRNADVKGVVVEVDSFGGMVNGVFETAAALADLSKAKPTIAILTDYAYSAAYLLASQCRQIVAPMFGGAGSIGAVMLHADYSGALEQEGIKVTLIKSGANKVDGNPYEPLPAEQKARWQAQVDNVRDQFAAVVGKGRGKRMTKAQALKTEAQAFTAAEALDLGLIDAVGDGQEAFAAFVKEVNRRS
ncbi:S49 family peptidase [Rhodopseudomonas sp. BR0C11]|uniref:S49 family peptidase n=1 Tax=Rhodopseudomonas sp. BR0C11 TaxID=2269370 RepID=UPI0013DF278B|nr:S49 family peptidase [Rhodopseudomonas sp. BR0C11]NEV79423.1 S49 family peptidase [Rhodopseudomonas sp. BR0C11]